MKKRILYVIGTLFALSVVCGLIFVYMAFIHGFYAASDRPVGPYTGPASLAYLPDLPCYKIAQNRYNQPIFEDPDAAFQQATKDYAHAIQLVYQQFHEAYRLDPFGKHTYQAYKSLGWQLTTDDEAIRKQGSDLTKFLDLYENSEKRWFLTPYGWDRVAP